MTADRRPLGRDEEPSEDSAVAVHYPSGITEIWAYMSSWNGGWNNVGGGSAVHSWRALIGRVQDHGAEGPFLLTEDRTDAYRRGWRNGRRDLRHHLESVVEDIASRDPEETPDA